MIVEGVECHLEELSVLGSMVKVSSGLLSFEGSSMAKIAVNILTMLQITSSPPGIKIESYIIQR
jgi:hypothetical protein